MSPPPSVFTAQEGMTSHPLTAIIIPPEDRQANQDALGRKPGSDGESTAEEIMEEPTPIREEEPPRQRSTSAPPAPEIQLSVEDALLMEASGPVPAREGSSVVEQEQSAEQDEDLDLGQEQDPDQPQHRHIRDKTISVTPEPVLVGEESIVVEEGAGPQQDENREEKIGFDLDKVYTRDEIAEVTDFPYRRLGETRKRKHGKRSIEEIWVEWMPLSLTPDAVDLLEKRYGPVEEKVLTEKDGAECYVVEFKGSWETGVRE